MVSGQETDRIHDHGAPPAPSGERDFASVMDSTLTRMGGSDIIIVSAADSQQSVGDRFRAIVTKLITHRSKEPLQVFHWMPAAEYKSTPHKPKHPVTRVDIGGHPMVGIPYPHYFPKNGGASDLMVSTADGDVSLLKHLRALAETPGHAVTFFRGEIRQPNYTYMPTAPQIHEAPVAVMSTNSESRVSQQAPRLKRTLERGKRDEELKIPETIKLFFTLPPDDREDILSRMPDKMRQVMENMFYTDEAGLHRRHASQLGKLAGSSYALMKNAVDFIHARMRKAEDGTVTRLLTNLEHNRLVFGIHAPAAGSEMSLLLTTMRDRSGKKKKKKKGWIKE